MKVKFKRHETDTDRIMLVEDVVSETEQAISVVDIDNELTGLRSRIKYLKALKKGVNAFVGKNVAEGEETIDPSSESA